jgi:NTE family protein
MRGRAARLGGVSLLLVLGLLVGADASAHPRIGLVLSGGGARGAAHIGVIQVLEELHVPIDCIAGTSMGSIIGGLYAAGYTVPEMQQALLAIPWSEVFKDAPPREQRAFRRKQEETSFLVQAKPGFNQGQITLPKGAIQGQKLDLILQQLTLPVASIRQLDQLPIPYRAVATDLGTGAPVVLDSGNLAVAMRTSMSIPSALSPVQRAGRLLVDGGVSNNLPMDVARELCGEVLIVVNIGTPLTPADQLDSVLAVTGQLTTIMTQQNTQRQLATRRPGDILIEPDLGDITTLAFDRADEAIPIGAAAARAKQTALAQLALPPEAYQAYRSEHLMPARDMQPVIAFVRIRNTSGVDDRVIAEKLRIKPGERLDVKRLEEDLAIIYGLDLFERVTPRLVEENGQTGLLVQAIAKGWGPNYLQFGISLATDFKGDSAFNIGASYAMTGVNALGAEWRTQVDIGENVRLFSDFYQPLDYDWRYFIDPVIGYEAYDLGLFDDNNHTADYRIRRFGFGLEGGRNLGDYGELRLGTRWGWGDAKLQTGDANLPDGNFNDGYYFVRLTVDQLDDVNFPRKGLLSGVEFQDSPAWLGASNTFRTLAFEITQPYTLGKHTVLASAELAGKLSGETLDAQNRFFLGGFTRLSGYQDRELSGQYLALGRLVYYYRLDDTSAALTVPTYLGTSLEIGDVWQRRQAIFDSYRLAGSLFLGLDTFLGPMYLAGGLAEGDKYSLYFFLGRTF